MIDKKKLVILTGPTAVGKTELSIALAAKIGGEIISADSVQVYKHMDIGSAKIKPEEMQGIPHHLIDVLEPNIEFNVVLFQKMAQAAMKDIYKKGKIPIIVGGTGFYIQAILYNVDFTDSEDNHELREKYERIANEKGSTYLHELLRKVDEQSAEAIHKNNVKRVVRALEYYELTGRKISEHNEAERGKKSPYDFSYLVLNDRRERLYERIEKRVDMMVEEGLVEEVEKLLKKGVSRESTAMQALGYKEIYGYLKGEYDLDRAVYLIKRDTRHFAKRQITWFKRERDVTWIPKDAFGYDTQKMLAYILEKING